MAFDLFDLTKKRADLNPDKIAFDDVSTNAKRTYQDIENRSSKMAAWLLDIGVQQSDRIAILCRGRIEFFESLFACAKLGAMLVPLNWRMPSAELAPILADCSPNVLIYGREDEAVAKSFLDENCIGINLDHASFETKLAAYEPTTTREVWPGEDIWYLLYTSGTTGAPKAVIQTYQMAHVNAVNIGQAINISANDRTLNFLPLFHTAGINLHTLPTFINGGRIQLLDGFDVDRVIKILAAGEIDTFFAVPAIYQALAEHNNFTDVDLAKVRSFGCGGAPMPDFLVQKFAKKGALVCNGMGMTETGPTLFLMDEEHVEEKIGSVGKPQILCAVRLVGRDGKIVNSGEVGELEISGSGIAPGYFNNSNETKKAFTKDGWLKSGDLARQDKDGYFYIAGRSKEMFISGGENVFPIEIENTLAAHPAILEAAVIGVPDTKWGEVGHAFIMIRPDQELDMATIPAFCKQHLAGFKVPKHYTITPDFPRTAAGKIRKHLLNPPMDR